MCWGNNGDANVHVMFWFQHPFRLVLLNHLSVAIPANDMAVSAPETFPLCPAQLPWLMALINLTIFILCLKLVLHIRRSGVSFSLPNAVSFEPWIVTACLSCPLSRWCLIFCLKHCFQSSRWQQNRPHPAISSSRRLLLLIMMSDPVSPSWIKNLIHVKNFTLCHLSYMSRLHSVLNLKCLSYS